MAHLEEPTWRANLMNARDFLEVLASPSRASAWRLEKRMWHVLVVTTVAPGVIHFVASEV